MTDTRPTPALVSQRAAERLPRLALLLFCAAYLLPGLFGRDPWKNADIAAYGYMTSLLRGDSDWLHPSLAGLAAEGGVLPYWIGAGAMALLTPLGLDPALAARIPFTLLLAATMALVWYATLHLARTEAAQPLAFAFGGEAHPIDYARAIADGALLALIAALGLLQLGHETTPDLVQLAATALLLYGLAASPYRPWQGRIAVLLAPALLAASGAATTGLLLALAGTLISHRSSYADARRQVPWLLMGAALAVLTATVLDSKGSKVDTFNIDVSGSSGQFSWDGTTSSGQKYTDGLYQLQLSGTTDAGATITTTANAIGKVEDVQMLNGSPVVSINGAQYPTSMILRIAK